MRNAMWVGGGITGMGEIPMLGVKEKGIAKVIRDIFRNGEKGFFYDPSDLKTQYQDAAGTVPVTAAGQPVGLMLDKSKGLALGANIASPTNVIGAGLGGIEFKTAVVSPELEIGFWYKITINVSNYSGTGDVGVTGSLTAFPPSVIPIGIRSRSSNGLISFIALAQTSNTVLLYTRSSNNADFTDITIQKIAGNHAYQTTSAARPLFRQKPILGSELVVNGDFSSGTAGVAAKNNVTVAVTDGVLKTTNNGTFYGFAEMSFNTEVGKKYLLKADVIASSGSGASFHVASISNGSDILSNVAAETMAKGVVITAKTTSTYISLKVPTNVVDSWRTFDNVSAKELQGYYTDKNYVEYDTADDKLTTTLSAQLTGCTVIRSVPNVGTQILIGQTIPATYEDNKDHCGLIVINRALTATETSQITKLFNKAAGV